MSGPGPYDWRVTTRSMDMIKVPERMLQSLVFKRRVPTDADFIEVTLVYGSKKLAPFVTNVEGGTLMETTRRETRTIRTPRIRPKKRLPASDLLSTTAPGQIFYANSAQAVRDGKDQKIATEQKDQKNTVLNRIEWMCAQALDGKINVQQDNTSFQVDFLMPATHQIVLLAGDRWSEDTADIKGQIDDYAQLIIDVLNTGPDLCIMGGTAAKHFSKWAEGSRWFDAKHLHAGEMTWRASSNYMGHAGGIDYYRYGGKYETDLGVDTHFIAPNKAYFINTKARFSIRFGIILDLKADARVVGEIFSKMWEEEDPSVLNMVAESRPLPVPWQPGSIVSVQVCD